MLSRKLPYSTALYAHIKPDDLWDVAAPVPLSLSVDYVDRAFTILEVTQLRNRITIRCVTNNKNHNSNKIRKNILQTHTKNLHPLLAPHRTSLA